MPKRSRRRLANPFVFVYRVEGLKIFFGFDINSS